MMIVGKDEKNTGKFSYEIYGPNRVVEVGGNFPTYRDAESAGVFAHRAYHASSFSEPENPFVNDYMSLDDIFAELEFTA